MERVVCIPAAKVRIVKVWDPELQLACDINVNNVAAIENTRMIKTYIQLDDRVRPLAMIIKYWTKRRILNDAGKSRVIAPASLLTIDRHWWHNQLVHMDMYDSQLSSNAGSARPAYSARASPARARRDDRPAIIIEFRRRYRKAEGFWREEQRKSGPTALSLLQVIRP